MILDVHGFYLNAIFKIDILRFQVPDGVINLFNLVNDVLCGFSDFLRSQSRQPPVSMNAQFFHFGRGGNNW